MGDAARRADERLGPAVPFVLGAVLSRVPSPAAPASCESLLIGGITAGDTIACHTGTWCTRGCRRRLTRRTDSPHLADRPDALRLCPTGLRRPMGHGRRQRVAVPSHENGTGAGANLRHRGRPAHSDAPRYGRDRSGDRGRFRRSGSPQETLGRGFAVSRPGLVRTNAPWCGALRVRANAPCPRCSTQPVAFPGASTDWAGTALTEAATPEACSATGGGRRLLRSPTGAPQPPRTPGVDRGTRHR